MRFSLDEAGADCRAIITNSPHNTEEATAIVRNVIALADTGASSLLRMLFKNIWGDEKGRNSFFNRPSFLGEIVCCWRARWILGSKGSPEHACAWYVWRREPKSGLAEGSRQRSRSDRRNDRGHLARGWITPKALDLYSGAGGATRGLQDAGFAVTGVDIVSQPRYVGDRFICADVLLLTAEFIASFDFVWSSPPCQFHSATKVLHNAKPHLNLSRHTRAPEVFRQALRH